jgi:methanogenic corrinoid protein MtbC1
MLKEQIFEQYLDALFTGNRRQCQLIVEDVLHHGTPAISIYLDIIWPIMVEVERLLRLEKITTVQEHMATRINRAIVDQLQNKLPRKPSRYKKIIVCCASDELQELGAQIMADLFESNGWEVKLVGGGLNNDEILAFVNTYAPDILLIYGATPKQAPGIRQLINTVDDVNAWPDMKIMVSGGLFGRAEGLWEEIGADLYATTAQQAVQIASNDNTIQPEQKTTEINPRRKKHRKELIAQSV